MALSYLTISAAAAVAAAAAVDTSLSPPDKLAASAASASAAGYDDTELGIEKLEEEGEKGMDGPQSSPPLADCVMTASTPFLPLIKQTPPLCLFQSLPLVGCFL